MDNPGQSMQQLLEESPNKLRVLRENDVVEGMILSVGKYEVYVDVPGVGIGVVRGRELYDDEQVLSPLELGDKVYASVIDIENRISGGGGCYRRCGFRRVREIRR